MHSITAFAKLNLFLHITGRRADGFHLLQSVFAFTEFGDRIDVSPAAKTALHLQGPFAADISSHDNLALKAAAAAGASVEMVLHKHIPVGAGLGGGSADAAAVLSALATPDDANNIAPQLGSDVPACLAARPAFVEGVGEKVTPLAFLADAWVVLVNPRMQLATADVYRGFSGAFSRPVAMPGTIADFAALLSAIGPMHNDLEPPALKLAPVIGEVLGAIRAQAAALARMSGSGATCFGLFDTEGKARQAAQAIGREHPGWWCVASKLRKSA